MIPLTLSEIASVTSGKIINTDDTKYIVTNVCTDTRNIEQGALFLALEGASFNAHDFLVEAEKSGAKAVVAHQQTNCTLPTVLVEDTRIALGQIGAYVKSKISQLKCAAITGSNGKTTTKEMLAAILTTFSQAQDSVLATAGNFNNDIGLPLTLLRLTEKTKFAVLELGANHQGEIAYTAKLAKPDVALINNVMPAHLEGFGSIEGIAKAKGEIWSSLTTAGTGVVNLDANFSERYIKQLTEQQSQVFTFSQSDSAATLFASHISFDEMGRGTFKLNYQQQSLSVTLNLAGKHNISNALAAAGMSIVLGCDLATICQGLGTLNEVAGRVNSTAVNKNLTLIDDSYNANSASLKAAIDLLVQCAGETMLIFADMGELGKYSEEEHRSVGSYAAEKGVKHLLTVGKLTEFTAQSYNELSQENGLHFVDKSSLKKYLTTALPKNSNKKMTILVKGSRGTKMEEIVTFIKQPKIG